MIGNTPRLRIARWHAWPGTCDAASHMTPSAPCLAIRVDAVQQALLSFTGIPLADQLVMFNGARLDPARTLGSYGLPVVRGLT